MALKAKRVEIKKGKGKLVSPLLDTDNYPARVVQVVDLGLQANKFDKGETHYRMMLTYELSDAFCLDEEGNDVLDKPRWFSEEINVIDLPEGMDLQDIYTDQYRGKAKMVIRARAFDPKGVHDFDFSKYLDSPCAVTMIQKKKKDGTLKNEVGNVTAPMRGMVVPELVNEPKFFSLDEPDLEVFKSLPDWVQEKIKENLEFNGSPLQKLLGIPYVEPEPEGEDGAQGGPDEGDEKDEGEDAPW